MHFVDQAVWAHGRMLKIIRMSSDSWHSRTGQLLTSRSLMKKTSGSAISESRSLTGLHGAGTKAKADMARVGD